MGEPARVFDGDLFEPVTHRGRMPEAYHLNGETLSGTEMVRRADALLDCGYPEEPQP